MKRILLMFLCLGMVLSLGATDASAIGLGLGIDMGSGDADVTIDGLPAGTNDIETTDFGFVLDTNLSGDSTFNYRLTLAAAGMEFKDTSFDSLNGITIVNDFGFGIVKNSNFRLWMGPELRLSWLDQTTDSGSELDLFSFGFGPVIGANFNIGSTVTLSLTGAYIFHTTNGEYYSSFSGWWYDFESDGENLILGAHLLFRLNE